ncbi:hypothetical protein DFH94DRAFT_266164 [Russula ochroleuca]|uniref:Uncharacterized protein n=1 Tax=Russula ochroleuca TaxID=152965 RepID=A0A9P5TCV7_9AGAM|nr:hypothetical protein DFH94DRAFT_266164 [Russula ochroleuca]
MMIAMISWLCSLCQLHDCPISCRPQCTYQTFSPEPCLSSKHKVSAQSADQSTKMTGSAPMMSMVKKGIVNPEDPHTVPSVTYQPSHTSRSPESQSTSTLRLWSVTTPTEKEIPWPCHGQKNGAFELEADDDIVRLCDGPPDSEI